MSETEERIFNEIMFLIKDNLHLLIRNNDSCLYYFKEYCNRLDISSLPIESNYLKYLTEEALYALLNADFLYDFRDIE